MQIKLRQLKVFKTIVEAGSISDAANYLHLTQSAVSKTLAGLEKELEFQLFDRIGRRLKLSQKGKLFYTTIENAMETFEGIQTAAKDIKNNQGHRLRICAIGPMIYSEIVPSAITKFASKNPDFGFSIDLVRRIDMEDWVTHGHSDIGITLLPVETSNLNFKPLSTVRAVAAVPSTHPLAKHSTLSPENLVGVHLIMPRLAARLRGLVEAAFVDAGINMRIQTQTTSAISLAPLVSNGLGVSVLDPYTVSAMPKNKVTAILWEPKIELTYGFIWSKSRVLGEAELEFIEQVENEASLFETI